MTRCANNTASGQWTESGLNMLYELRIYTVIPSKMPDLMQIWQEVGDGLIRKHLNCLGVWTTESGTLNKVYHLYGWKSYEERDKARADFYATPEAKDYVAKVKAMYQSQESIILTPTQFSLMK
jgi:hypothetical protein